jgi:uncharacterized protein YjhX (UPF0386 family)
MEAAWGAFGSDSDSDDDDADKNEHQAQTNALFESTAAAATVAITQYFASLTKTTGVGLGERVVAITSVLHGNECGESEVLRTMMAEWVVRRGMKVVAEDDASSACDSAVLIVGDIVDLQSSSSLNILHRLVPGGVVWLNIKGERNETGNIISLDCFSQSIWEGISYVSTISPYAIYRIQKRSCLVNAWIKSQLSKKRWHWLLKRRAEISR